MASPFKKPEQQMDKSFIATSEGSTYVPPAKKEADHEGAAKRAAVPVDHPDRASKGDLGMEKIEGFEPRPLTSKGAPWKGMRRR